MTDFYVDSNRADGRMSKCRECFRSVALRPEMLEKIQERDRKRGQLASRKQIVKDRLPKYKDKPYRQSSTMRAKYPEKAAARRALANAIKGGDIVKPAVCQSCGSPATGRNLHGHHKDYSKALKVDWLCTACHGDEHRRENEAAREAQALKTAAE
jgi:hypothetical protein